MKSTDQQMINKTPIIQKPVWADISIDSNRVSGSYQGKYKKSQPNIYIDYAKQMAVGNAIQKANCDFLVHPLYDVLIEGNTVEVTVTGYAAKYKRFRQLEAKDSNLIREVKNFNTITEPVKVQQTTKNNNIKKNSVGKALGITLGATMLVTGLIAALL